MRAANREVVVGDDVAAVTSAVRAGLTSLGAKTTDTDTTGCITARTGSSARTFGEVISVELTPVADGTKVQVNVSTAVRATLVDCGATKHVADHLIRAASDPAWAQRAAAAVGRPVVPAGWVWLGAVIAVCAAGLAFVPAAADQRTALLLVAAAAAVLWTLAVLTKALGIRRRGQFVPPWHSIGMLAGTLGVGFTVADALKPRHAPLAVSSSADASALVGAMALTALVVTAVRRSRLLRKESGDRGA